jgi:hypothetical protein
VLLLFLALGALALQQTGSWTRRWSGSAGENRLSHAIRLMLQRIVNRSDPELSLNSLIRCAPCEALGPLRPIREVIAYSRP